MFTDTAFISNINKIYIKKSVLFHTNPESGTVKVIGTPRTTNAGSSAIGGAGWGPWS